MLKSSRAFENRIAKAEQENENLRRSLSVLRKQIDLSDADWEVGKKSPRDLAIRWMCMAVNIRDFDANNRLYLMDCIDRLIALYQFENAKNEGCAGDDNGEN